MTTCTCEAEFHSTKLIVLTGGPGAGKTAVLEMIKQYFCEHIGVLPEAAGIIFSGGFWREGLESSRKAAQRAIFHVQREQEALVLDRKTFAAGLCDRGTLDGLAYWPGEPEEFFRSVGTTMEAEISRYAMVIHLRTPSAERGYNLSNPVRIESAAEAAEIDLRIEKAWERHPRRQVIGSHSDFLHKAKHVLDVIRSELPECCRSHAVPPVDT